ncbi:ABC transporter ATP-binding protein [Paenibacillus apiarius]|uniref:ABC transporter ATP-binding protein n=2 Tax=Paenibacillus apiarius TaxID=46240 RepID=A0ABT4DRQ6_9BACL|nr:ABC transporter ATP-binding protein [Paenibacillus apiarius]MCY9520037.1 ABC transporter ATP-binding protein [Paenibacillus apiarius]MCY9554340.1 ABC transporter ATP-binding protein [Paenibacillus apiarius]MCY9558131.1 ABC transporter ATP-binding protein [Paenibacillus apiarius]MCY9684926.1 ABC transporter ATP-binding protein [Paenibacillus apiarius]
MMLMIELVNVEKHFAGQPVVHPLSLTIDEGEFLTLLGPSGCGKTTILRMIAGFEQPTTGEIRLDGENVTDLPPNKRNLNLVFQHYALFPHMTVEQNIQFGLKMKKIPQAEQRERIAEAIRLTQLTPLAKRYPHQLSGGQQQRVAIARAIANHPKVLLLDEPLGALDLQLRKNLQGELKQLQRNLGITFVYVTHDQEEAMMMSDRIVIMNNGHVEQVGSPKDIYERPETLFAATFVGENNVFHEDHMFAVRPEKIRVTAEPEDGRKSGIIQDIVYLGNIHKLIVHLAHEQTNVTAALDFTDERKWEIGQRVGVNWNAQDEVMIGP